MAPASGSCCGTLSSTGCVHAARQVAALVPVVVLGMIGLGVLAMSTLTCELPALLHVQEAHTKQSTFVFVIYHECDCCSGCSIKHAPAAFVCKPGRKRVTASN